MRSAHLKLDGALDAQTHLVRCATVDGFVTIPATDIGPALRLWSRPPVLALLDDRVKAELPAGEGKRLVFAGSGDFHHVTPTLIRRALEVTPGPVTVVHIDNHPDWVRFSNGLHCGSWVGAAARIPDVAKVVTLGVCSSDIGLRRSRSGDLTLVTDGLLALYPYRAPGGRFTISLAGHSWPSIEALGLSKLISALRREIATTAIYISIDKDVLRPADAETNWDQGLMSASELYAILAALMDRYLVIGADVVGDWSPPSYGSGIQSALKRAEAILDQPWLAPVGGRRVNEAVNLRLLDLFAEAA